PSRPERLVAHERRRVLQQPHQTALGGATHMANTFLTTQQIAREALLRLRANQVMARLVHTDFSAEFGSFGDTIRVRKPATFAAEEFSGTTTPQNIEEGYVNVAL